MWCWTQRVSLRLESKQRGYVTIAKLTNFHIQKWDGDKYDLTWCLPNCSSSEIFTEDGLQCFCSRKKNNHPNRNTLYCGWERFENIELDLSLQVWAEKLLRLNNTLNCLQKQKITSRSTAVSQEQKPDLSVDTDSATLGQDWNNMAWSHGPGAHLACVNSPAWFWIFSDPLIQINHGLNPRVHLCTWLLTM